MRTGTGLTMRPLGKNIRGRGRGGRRGNSYGQINRHTTLDSNGPGVRLRGNALQLYEKYISLGNEAAAAGERITAEAHYQHADHYFRVHQIAIGGGDDARRKPMPQPNPAASPASSAPTNSTATSTAASSTSTDGKVSNGLAGDSKDTT